MSWNRGTVQDQGKQANQVTGHAKALEAGYVSEPKGKSSIYRGHGTQSRRGAHLAKSRRATASVEGVWASSHKETTAKGRSGTFNGLSLSTYFSKLSRRSEIPRMLVFRN